MKNTHKVIWSDPAEDDKIKIFLYLSEHGYAINAADRMLEKIENAATDLSYNPYWRKVDAWGLGKLGFRKRNVGNYIIFFRINEEEKTVTIEAVIHDARDWAGLLLTPPFFIKHNAARQNNQIKPPIFQMPLCGMVFY